MLVTRRQCKTSRAGSEDGWWVEGKKWQSLSSDGWRAVLEPSPSRSLGLGPSVLQTMGPGVPAVSLWNRRPRGSIEAGCTRWLFLFPSLEASC